MGFISKLNSYQPDVPEFNPKKISMEDIAKCKGSGNFTVRFIGQIQTAMRTGKFVTDKTVAEFMNDRYSKIEDISKEFKKVAVSDTPRDKFEAKQIQKDQAIAIRLSKTFAEASKLTHGSYDFDLKTEMDASRAVLNGLKEMDQYNPADLLRAAVFEKNGGIRSPNDLKAQFCEFVKGKDIKNESDLKAAYHEFKNEMAKAANAGNKEVLEQMKAYTKDNSMRAYNLSAMANLDGKGLSAVRNMSISALLRANLAEKMEKPTLSQAEIQKTVSAASIMLTTYYQHGKDMPSSPGVDNIKADFNEFLEEYKKTNKMENDMEGFGIKNAFVIFQNGIVSAAKEGNPAALAKLQSYL